jgi:hypothetical protein
MFPATVIGQRLGNAVTGEVKNYFSFRWGAADVCEARSCKKTLAGSTVSHDAHSRFTCPKNCRIFVYNPLKMGAVLALFL